MIGRLKQKLREKREALEVNRLCADGRQAFYHVHIRKTAGTSINHAFLSSSTKGAEEVYEELVTNRSHRVISDGRVFVGWNRSFIERGEYDFAFSHIPYWKLSLAPRVFSFSCFRNPVERVFSLYNMLRHFQIHQIDHPCMQVEGQWLGNNFEDFIFQIPEEHLHGQIAMFSEQLNVDEALTRARELDFLLFQDELESGLASLGRKAGIELPIFRKKGFPRHDKFGPKEEEMVKERIQRELRFYNEIKAISAR